MPTDLWQMLAQESRPIVMYGMGNGADKILSVLERFGIAVQDFFASDGFVRGHRFHGKEVLSYAQIEEKYDDFVVLLSFATAREEVLANIKRIAAAHPLYAPDVPVVGQTLFDASFYQAHKEEFHAARALFCDAESRELFDCVVDYKLSGKIERLLTAYQEKDTLWHTVLHPESYRSYADLGAYCGDTAAEALQYAPHLEKIVAFEPDEKNFKKLMANAHQNGFEEKLCAYPYAAWDREEVLAFRQEGNRNAGVGQSLSGSGGKLKSVQAMPLDSVLCGAPIDYIKYDVEGAEEKALLGSERTLLAHRPDLCVSVYHRSEDLFALPLLLHRLCPEYRLSLRRLGGVPAWDLNLYASVR